MKKIRFKNITVTFSWTNWTFGIWWDCRRMHALGLDLGPLEFVYKPPRRANGMSSLRARTPRGM